MKPSHRMKIHLLEHHSFAVINIVFKEFENIIAYQKVEYLEKLL